MYLDEAAKGCFPFRFVADLESMPLGDVMKVNYHTSVRIRAHSPRDEHLYSESKSFQRALKTFRMPNAP